MDYLCFPEDTHPHRYALGRKGENNILVVGLNPSTANSQQLDPTSRNIEAIAKNNGYDGWLLVNLCSLRTPDTSRLPHEQTESEIWANLNQIRHLISADQFKFDTIWVAWGSELEYLHRGYLVKSACYLYRIVKHFKLKPVCIGTNIGGHPTHPSPLAIAKKHKGQLDGIKLKKFDYQDYNFRLSQKVKLEPEMKF